MVPFSQALGHMKPSPIQLEDFLANRPVPEVALALHDYVNVIEGEHAGDSGTVMGLADVGSDPAYVLELDSGVSVTVVESHLQHAGES